MEKLKNLQHFKLQGCDRNLYEWFKTTHSSKPEFYFYAHDKKKFITLMKEIDITYSINSIGKALTTLTKKGFIVRLSNSCYKIM